MSNPHDGSHSTDAIGTRDVDKEASQIMKKAQDSARPRPPGETPGVEASMLRCVEYIQLATVERYDRSTYVPSAHMLFTTIQELDLPLLTLRQFSSELLRWTPLHTRLYYGILFYIQTLRAMNTVSLLSSTNSVFLREFLDIYPPESLPIAGPLVVFFKALTACDAPLPEYGAISPYLPPNTGLDADQHGALPQDLRVLLPNITGIRNGIANTRLPLVNAAHVIWDHNLHNPTAGAAALPIAHNTPNHLARDARITPGTVHPVNMSPQALRAYATAAGHIRIPATPNLVANMSWSTYLGFSTDFSWFGHLASQMQKHSRFFQGSTTLASCAPKDGPTSLVINEQVQHYPNRNAHRDAAIESISHTTQSHALVPSVSPPCDKLGLFTQLNWIPSANFGPNDHAGAIDHTRHGPFWNITPARSFSQQFNPAHLVSQVIAQDFILDRPTQPGPSK